MSTKKIKYPYFIEKHLVYRHFPIITTISFVVVTIFTQIIIPHLPNHILRINFAMPSRRIITTPSEITGYLFHTDQLWWQLPLIIGIPWIVSLIASLLIQQKKGLPLPPIAPNLDEEVFKAAIEKRTGGIRPWVGFGLNMLSTVAALYGGILIIVGLVFNVLGYDPGDAALLVGTVYVFGFVTVITISLIAIRRDNKHKKGKTSK